MSIGSAQRPNVRLHGRPWQSHELSAGPSAPLRQPTVYLRTVYCLLLFAALWTIHRSVADYPADDFYIHARIASHLLKHGRPYFNLNEPVMAGSSAVFTLVLTGLVAVGGVSTAVAGLFNSAVLVAAGLTYGRLAQRVLQNKSPWIEITASLLVTAPLLESSLCLMETPLALLLLGLGVSAYSQSRPIAFFWLTLAVFTRLELAVCFLFFASNTLLRRRMPLRQVAACSLLGGLVPVIYDLYFFGTLVPQTVVAKSTVYSPSVLEFWQLICRFVYGPQVTYYFPQLIFIHALVVMPLFYYVLWQNRKRADLPGVAAVAGWFFACGVAIFAAYAAQRVLSFPWYMPLFTVPIYFAAGLWTWAVRSRTVTAAFLVYFAPPILALAFNAASVIGGPSWSTDFAFSARTRQYLAVGRDLQTRFPDASLMTSEIGALGRTFSGKIHDAVGLASHAAVRHHPLAVPTQRRNGYLGAIPPEYVREIRPELIVGYDAFVEALLQSDVTADYVLETQPSLLPEDRAALDPIQKWYGEQLHVWIRRDVYERSQTVVDAQ